VKGEFKRYIAVAGNMGVGKSTLVQFLTSQFSGHPFYEAVTDNPYFNKFFKDMRRWAFHSQLSFLSKKFHMHQRLEKMPGLVVLDRTIYEDAEIFAKGLYKMGNISKDDFDLYWELYRSMCQSIRPPDLLIFLTCSIKTLKHRIKMRGRLAEKSAPDSYLRRLQQDYEQWIEKVDFCPVQKIDTDKTNYLEDLAHRADIIRIFEKYLH